MKNYFLPALTFFLLALASCEDEPGCVTDESNVIRVGFLQLDDTTLRNADSVAITEIFPVGVGVIALDTTVAGLFLPLNPSTDSTTYYFARADGEVDTLALSYRREQLVVSPDCGATQRYTELTVLRHTFDDIRVVEPEVSELGDLNIEVYTCQDTFYTQEVIFDFQKRDTIARADTLVVQSVRNDAGQTLVAAGDTIFRSLRLPINPQTESTTFTFELLAQGDRPARTETLTLTYEQDTVRFGEACRLQTRYAGLEVADATFDSLRVEDDELAVDVPLNIEIVDILE